MDYFQGVVLEYLRADRACFVNPEFWLRGNETSPHEKPHWYVDVLAVNMREKAVYLCEVTYAKQPRALLQRLNNWHTHWAIINKTLRKGSSTSPDWPVVPWVFAPEPGLKIITPALKRLFPTARITGLESVLPWLTAPTTESPKPGPRTRLQGQPRSSYDRASHRHGVAEVALKQVSSRKRKRRFTGSTALPTDYFAVGGTAGVTASQPRQVLTTGLPHAGEAGTYLWRLI
jgi:hypothetical protein